MTIALLTTLAAGLVFGVVIGFCCVFPMLIIATAASDTIRTSIRPNQGIRNSLQTAAIICGVTATISLAVGLLWGLLDANSAGKGIAFGIILAAPVSLTVALIAGGGVSLQHYMLRSVLALMGGTPWRYQRFLDYATDRVFLRRCRRRIPLLPPPASGLFFGSL